MFEWLIANLATIIVTLAVVAVIVLIIVKMRKDKKQGKHSCGGNCAGCTLCHGHDEEKGSECEGCAHTNN